MRSPLVLAAFLVSSSLLAACGGGADNLPPPPPPPPPPPEATVAAPTAAPPAAEAPKPELPKVTLAAGTASPDPEGAPPSLKISAPAANQVLDAAKASDLAVGLTISKWAIAPGASHVHLILDNKPYKPVFDPKTKVTLGDLNGGSPLAEGQHVLVAFPSRANHESVKTKGAVVVVPFWVGKKGEPAVAPGKPMLIYSRPKGEYAGDMANHVLVDFQLAGVTLAPGKEHVAVRVTGPGIDKELTANVESFGAPLYLDNLRNGAYEITLELLDGKGAPVAGPWNRTTRTITVDHDAPTPATHHAATPSEPAKADGKDKPAAAKADGKDKPAAVKADSKDKPAPKKSDAASGPRTHDGTPMPKK